VAAVRKQAETLQRSGIAPLDAAEVIAKAIDADKPRARYLVGCDARVMAAVVKWLPDRAVDRLIARNLGLDKPEPTAAAASVSETLIEPAR
jgi:hypothetical protein